MNSNNIIIFNWLGLLVFSDAFLWVHTLLCCVHGQVQSGFTASEEHLTQLTSSPLPGRAAAPPTGFLRNRRMRHTLIYGDRASSSGNLMSLHTVCVVKTKTPCKLSGPEIVWRQLWFSVELTQDYLCILTFFVEKTYSTQFVIQSRVFICNKIRLKGTFKWSELDNQALCYLTQFISFLFFLF